MVQSQGWQHSTLDYSLLTQGRVYIGTFVGSQYGGMADRKHVMLTNVRIDSMSVYRMVSSQGATCSGVSWPRCSLQQGVTCPQGSHHQQRMGFECWVACEYVLKLTFPHDLDLVAGTGYLLQPVHGPLVPIGKGFIVPTYGCITERETCVTVPETAHKHTVFVSLQ